jgi:hypothetical protein
MKRRDNKEVSPKPKYYGGSNYSDDRSLCSRASTGRLDSDLNYWEKVPNEKTLEGPNGSDNPNDDIFGSLDPNPVIGTPSLDLRLVRIMKIRNLALIPIEGPIRRPERGE